MKYITVAATDKGSYRKTNQDCVLTCKKEILNDEVSLAVLCDGMGGLKYGDVASKIAVESFEKWFDDYFSQTIEFPTKEHLLDEWRRLIAEINTKIYDYAESVSTKAGTTLSAILLFRNQYVIGHVGDSRIYKIDREEISQLTEDHSLVAQEVRSGQLTPEQAKTDRRRHLLIRCLGVKKTVEPQFISGDIKKDDSYLLCSDGLWNKIDNTEMQEEVLNDKEAAENLIQDARSKNEKDNISVIIMIGEKKQEMPQKSNQRSNQRMIWLCLITVIAVIIAIILWNRFM